MTALIPQMLHSCWFFLRGVDSDFCISEELLDMKSLRRTTTGKYILKPYHVWLKTWISLWPSSMALQRMEHQRLLASRIEWLPWYATSLRKWRWGCENAPYLTSVLCGKAIQMDDVMTTVVKTINLICSRALKHREILVLLSDIDAEYGDVINHSNERWLSHTSALQQFYSLRSTIEQ